MASFPGALSSLKETFAGTDQVATEDHAAVHNAVADEVNAIEAELGTDPSASFADVKTRLNARLTCRKTADQTISSSVTLTNITDLLLPIATTGIDYYFKFIVIYQSNTLTNGVRVALTCPALTGYISWQTTIYGRVVNSAAAPPAVTYSGTSQASGNVVVSDAVGAINTNYPIVIEGILSNPSATGNIQFQGANEVSTANGNIFKRGSWGEVYIG